MKRINKIDILRAIGITLMILGHVFDFFGKFDRYIHTFHMPLFFIVSGFLFKSKTDIKLNKLILQKMKRLLIPYCSFAIINYLAWIFLEKGDQVWYKPLIKLVTYNTNGLPICGALWFLTALFWTETFYIILDRIVKKYQIRSILVITIAVLASWIQNKTDFRLPLTIDTGLVCMGFYEIGRLCKLYGGIVYEKLKNYTIGKLIGVGSALAIINAVLAFVNPYVNIKSGWFGIVPLFWINALIGVAACYMLALLLDRILKDTNLIKKYLISIGTGSIVFLGFNQVAILCSRIILVHTSLNGNIWILNAFAFVIVMIVLHLLYLALNKINSYAIKIMFGI